MGDVVDLGVTTTQPPPVNKVLTAAAARGLETVLVVGLTAEGETYLALSSSDAERAVFLLEVAKYQVIQGALEK